MKKLFILLAVLVIAGNAEAKIRVGLKGGLNFSSLSFSSSVLETYESRTGWHAGAMLNIGLPLGLSLQPELLYSSKGVNEVIAGVSSSKSFDYAELAVDLQWGISLPLVRPFVSLTPYVGYAIGSDYPMSEVKNWDAGIGVGAGVDIWKLQVSLKYCWGFGKVSDLTSISTNRNIMLSLGFFL